MNRSSAATTAAASSAEAVGATMVSFGRRFIGERDFVGGALARHERIVPAVPELPVLDQDAVLHAVSATAAIERVREGLLRYHAGEWAMPPKVYLESPPFGDFRAMPSLGDGFALLKWVTTYPLSSDGRLSGQQYLINWDSISLEANRYLMMPDPFDTYEPEVEEFVG